MISGTWYLVGLFPETQQHATTATYTVDAHHHHRNQKQQQQQPPPPPRYHQRQASAGAGAQLVVVVVVTAVLDLKIVVEVSGTCYLLPGIRRNTCILIQYCRWPYIARP